MTDGVETGDELNDDELLDKFEGEHEDDSDGVFCIGSAIEVRLR